MATAVIEAHISNSSTKRKGTAPAIRKLKLRHPELNSSEIARQVGCSPANVSSVLRKFLSPDQTRDDLTEFQNNKADIFDSLQSRILGSITESDIAKAPLVARVTSAAILEDKSRVIRGMATQINVSVLMDAVNLAKEIQAQKSAETLESVRNRMALERQSAVEAE